MILILVFCFNLEVMFICFLDELFDVCNGLKY